MDISIASWRHLSSAKAGGAENFTHDLLCALSRLGHDVTWQCLGRAPNRHSGESQPYKVEYFGDAWLGRRRLQRYHRKMQERGSDLFIEEINTVPLNLRTGDPRKRLLIFQTCEDLWPYIAPSPVASIGRLILEPHWLRKLAEIPTVTISRSSKSDLQRFGFKDVTVVQPPSSIWTEAFTPNKYETPTIVHTGRLVAYKQIDELLAAYSIARLRIPTLKLHIIGTGPQESRLRRLSDEQVIFHGRLSEEERDFIVQSAHLLVATSRREGWGLVVSEAANLGTPALAYNVAGLRDSVQATGGYLCPPSPLALGLWLPSVLESVQQISSDLRPGKPVGKDWDDVAARMLEAWTK